MVTAIGVGENFPQAHDWPPQSGVFFSAEHVTRYAQVVVLGTTVAKNLFPAGANPLGQYVLIGNAPFLVIGVLSSKGSTPRGDDQDNSVLVALHNGRSTHLWTTLFPAHHRESEAGRGHERGASWTPYAADQPPWQGRLQHS